MKKFLLLMHENLEVLESLTEKDFGELFEAHSAWAEKMGQRGHLISGDGLEESGAMISTKHITVSKEPFITNRTMIGGYYLLQGETLDEILELSKDCPCHLWGGTTEIRQIMEYQ